MDAERIRAIADVESSAVSRGSEREIRRVGYYAAQAYRGPLSARRYSGESRGNWVGI